MSKKMTKITISIGDQMAEEIVGCYLKNPAYPQFHCYMDTKLRRQIGNQVVKQHPEIVESTRQYKIVHELDVKLRTITNLKSQNNAIWEPYKLLMQAEQVKGDEINREANKHYQEAARIRSRAMAESDALFNAEFRKQGITLWGYKDGYIQYLKPEEVKSCANSCEASVES